MNLKTLQSEIGVSPASLDYLELFRQLPDAYVIVEAAPEFRVVDVNAAQERMSGISRKHSIGLPLFAAFPDKGPDIKGTGQPEALRHLKEVMRTRKPMSFEPFRYDTADDAGYVQIRYWRTSYWPLSDQKHGMRYIVMVVRDATDEVRAARRIASVEDRLEAALAVGKVGSWVWDVETNRIAVDRNLARLFHMTKERLAAGVTIEHFLQAVCPEDRRRVEEAIRHCLEVRVPFEQEFRITLLDGAQRWVLARGKAEEEDGRVIFPGVIVDITERRDLQAQVELARRQDQLNRRAARVLQKRNEELEAINHSKDEFVALASHQLRTPATAVKQYLGMVLQGYTGELTRIQSDMLGKAFESNERQIQIINQILNAARADTGKLIMVPIPLDLRVLVRGVWNDMRSLFEQRRQRYRISVPRQAVLVSADQSYLRMAIENLLHNAALYTPDGGTVTLQLTRVGTDTCRLAVTDSGVGIKKADLGKLFAKFSRIHNPLSVQAGGSGIGLYLASEIVRLHGGAISVNSKIRQGSTFAISLPLMLE